MNLLTFELEYKLIDLLADLPEGSEVYSVRIISIFLYN